MVTLFLLWLKSLWCHCRCRGSDHLPVSGPTAGHHQHHHPPQPHEHLSEPRPRADPASWGGTDERSHLHFRYLVALLSSVKGRCSSFRRFLTGHRSSGEGWKCHTPVQVLVLWKVKIYICVKVSNSFILSVCPFYFSSSNTALKWIMCLAWRHFGSTCWADGFSSTYLLWIFSAYRRP